MSSRRIISSFAKIQASSNLRFSASNNRSFSHAYHRYPAKFIPSIASYYIKQYSKKGDLVLDPFGGCGTTLVEAKINGRRSIGIDINPLARLISKVKVTAINPEKLSKSLDNFLSGLDKISRYKTEIKNDRLLYWFSEKALNDLASIYRNIQKIEDAEIRRFYECGFSNILKNCSRWLMKSLKPQIDREKKIPDAAPVFIKQIKFMLIKNEEYFKELLSKNNIKTQSRVYTRDARKTGLMDNSMDYIITSPPYVTSYEYADLHQLSLLWLEKANDWTEFKKRFIGSSYSRQKNIDIKSPIGDEIIDKLVYNDAALSRSVRAYFEDMSLFIKEAKRVLKRGKSMTIVIGNTILKGVDILNAEVAYEQMVVNGFPKIKIEKRQTSFSSIAPFRDRVNGKFTSKTNLNKRRAYEFEYILTATK